LGGQLGGSFNDELGGGLARDGSAAGGKLGGAMGSRGGAAGASSTSFRWHCEGKAMLSTQAGRKDLATTVSRHRPGRASDLERRPPTRTTRAGGVSSVSSNGPESTLGGESTPIFFAVYPLKRFKRQLKRQGCTCPNTPNATKLPQTNQSYRKLGRYHCRVINAHNASCSTCTLILHGISQHLPNGASPTFLPRPDIATRNTSVSTTRVL
jgi:hypothetical protein